MSQINILPKEVYQLIAAGEVVERPASIIKEMVENSIDAGAKNITVEIKNGGITYMRITDDGCGIEKDDVEKVFISHATSKIKESSDLNSISTLGFRGEAMASIGAVAKVELLTKSKNESDGTRYVIHGGEEMENGIAGCPDGTTIVVRDIFYNTPARMKFLKKDVGEGNAVASIVDKAALSHPEISFRFIRDGKQVLITPGNNVLKSTVYSVFGKEVSDSLVPVDYELNKIHVTGFVSKPSASRKSRAMQFYFINGRMVISKTAMAATEQAYKNSIMVGRHPAAFINIECDTAMVDVNIHPAKTEVRFANDKPIFDAIYYGVKNAVNSFDTVKEAKLGGNKNPFADYGTKTEHTPEPFEHNGKLFAKKDSAVQTKFDFNSADKQSDNNVVYSTDNYKTSDNNFVVESSKKAYVSNPDEKSGVINFSSNNIPVDESQKDDNSFKEKHEPHIDIVDETEVKPEFKVIGEAFKTYIIVQIKNELYFIDKHAAHERMNFEKLKSQQEIATQLLLSPVTVNLTNEEFIAVSDNFNLLSKCGFEVDEFGTNSVIVRAIPALVVDDNIADLILEIAQKLLENKTDIEPDKIDWIFHSASCRGAVKAGDYTSPEEQRMFVEKLLSMPNIRYCPHGRPVMIKMSKYDIEKQFGRV